MSSEFTLSIKQLNKLTNYQRSKITKAYFSSNFSLLVSFPFASNNHSNKLDNEIYSCTYKILKEIEFSSCMLSLDKESHLYSHCIDTILCANKSIETLDYPKVELFENNKKIDTTTIPDFVCTIEQPSVKFKCKENLLFYKEQELLILQYIDNPPCKLGDIQIIVSGKLKLEWLEDATSI